MPLVHEPLLVRALLRGATLTRPDPRVRAPRASQHGEAAFQYNVQLEELQQFERMVAAILQLPGVTRVIRGSMRELKRARSSSAFWALASCDATLPAFDAYDSSGLAQWHAHADAESGLPGPGNSTPSR